MSLVLGNQIENIYAIGRLYEFCSNKRFHLIKNEFLYDEVGLKALHINEQIKSKNGIDLFQATSENDLGHYEKALNQFTTTYSEEIFGKIEIGDEMKLLDLKAEFPVEKLSAFKITIDQHLKPLIKSHNLAVQDIINFCKSADAVEYVAEGESFFLSKAIKIKNKNKIIMIHLTVNSSVTPMNNNRIHMNYLEKTKSLAYESLRIQMLFILEKENFINILHNPIRLFIRCIDIYGAAVKINNSIKKFFYHELLPPFVNIENIDKYLDELIARKYRNDEIKFVSLLKNSRIQLKLIFLYTINLNTLIKK